MHFQLQVTIGSYGYEPVELYLVHGVLAFLALVVVHCILTEVRVTDLAYAGHPAAFSACRAWQGAPCKEDNTRSHFHGSLAAKQGTTLLRRHKC